MPQKKADTFLPFCGIDSEMFQNLDSARDMVYEKNYGRFLIRRVEECLELRSTLIAGYILLGIPMKKYLGE